MSTSSQRASRSPAHTSSQRESGAQLPHFKHQQHERAAANLPSSVAGQQTSPSMIGPPPSFYDPNQAIVPEGQDYQQWIMEHYGAGSQQQQPQQQPQQYGYAHGAMSGNVPQVPFQPHSQAQPSQMHSHSVHVPHTQNQYNPYGEMSYDPHLVQAAPADRPQRGLPAARGARNRNGGAEYPHQLRVPGPPSGAYQQPQQQSQQQQQTYPLRSPATNESYFPVAPGPASSDSAFSQQYNFVVGYQPDAFSATPSSDLTPLPSSVSTPSVGGTDEGTSHVHQLPAQHHGAQQAHASLARQHAGGRRPRGGKTPKRARVEDGYGDGDSDSSEDESSPFQTVSMPPPQGQSSLPTRLPGACKHCKKLKMRCEFPPDDNTCKRCKSGGHQCIVEGRKPRNAPNKREYLLAQIRQKNAIIESLLKQIHNPYLATPMSIASYRMATSPTDQNNQNVLAWLDRLQASVQSAGANAGANAFKMDTRPDAVGAGISDDSDEDGAGAGGDGAGERTERGSVGNAEDDEPLKDAEDRPTALPHESAPIGLLANLALDKKSKRKKKAPAKPKEGESSDDDVGVACETFFDPGPAYNLGLRATMIDSVSPPDILVHGLVTPDDVDKLFKIYFERVNIHCDVLDPVLHTPASTFARCPFLFTVVCAISSRYYAEKSDIYPIAMHFAKHAAASALLNGWKSVELSQAYLLMSLYGVPARRWEEDRNWLYTGLAIRIATDLNLHVVSNVKPKTEKQEREMVNQTRVWLLCFNLDRSTSAQFGKPSTIKEDYTIRHSADWYKSSRMNSPLNIGTSAYAAVLRIVSRFHEAIFSDPESPTGLNQSLDFRSVILEYDAQLSQCHEEWMGRFERDSDLTDPALKFRAGLLPFIIGYSRLVMFSFGFQQALKRGFQPEDQMFVEKCFEAAKSVIVVFIDSLIPMGYMKTSPDGHFVFASFASAFLLKLLRPEFSANVSRERQEEIFTLISRLIDRLGSQDVAIDERHTPALHSRFLHGLLRKHRRDLAVSSRFADQQPPSQPPAQQAANRSGNAPGQNMYGSQQQASAQQQQQQQPYSTLGGSGAHGSYESVSMEGSSPASFISDSSLPMSMSPAFETEPAYTPTTINGSGPAGVNGVGSEGMFQFGTMQDEHWGPLLALQNPNYWKDMMMPGFSWPESPPSMDQTNGFDTYSQYQMAPIISG